MYTKIVLIGGGNGVYNLTRSLKLLRPLTLIQTVFDHGGHTGALRDKNGDLFAVGDLRRGIAALADPTIPQSMLSLLSHRFADGSSMGNLMLAALMETCAGPAEAIHALCDMYKVRGQVLPISLGVSEVKAVLDDDSVLGREDLIDTRSLNDYRKIQRVFLDPVANIYIESAEAIVGADIIVFCPGSPFTSIIPNLLVKGFAEALRLSKAKLVFVSNIFDKYTESPSGGSVEDLMQTYLTYMGASDRKFHTALINNAQIPLEVKQQYMEKGFVPASVQDRDRLGKLTEQVIEESFAQLIDDESGHKFVRHSAKTASVIANL